MAETKKTPEPPTPHAPSATPTAQTARPQRGAPSVMGSDGRRVQRPSEPTLKGRVVTLGGSINHVVDGEPKTIDHEGVTYTLRQGSKTEYDAPAKADAAPAAPVETRHG